MQYLKKEIRDKILVAAVDEFKQHGYADASIRNIANNAEISLGNIYRYFTNKEALYFAVINPFIESIKQSIEKDFVFTNKSMKEISEVLVQFLMTYSDELLIIRKGKTVHKDTFVNYIEEVISKKVEEMLVNAFPEINVKITNKDFYSAIASGFLTSLFKVLRNEDSREQQERYTRELITFYFGHMKDRFYHFDEE
ncbi:MAG: TetR/AcrR family transcriptional regulator [Clostridia bacterium]|nr:TetR/AcrR family transcriptional regulator [Clostridia bacterium]MBR2966645.1 TetR/AcrR family transcriptional regulator [Clostridia bacterium]